MEKVAVFSYGRPYKCYDPQMLENADYISPNKAPVLSLNRSWSLSWKTILLTIATVVILGFSFAIIMVPLVGNYSHPATSEGNIVPSLRNFNIFVKDSPELSTTEFENNENSTEYLANYTLPSNSTDTTDDFEDIMNNESDWSNSPVETKTEDGVSSFVTESSDEGFESTDDEEAFCPCEMTDVPSDYDFELTGAHTTSVFSESAVTTLSEQTETVVGMSSQKSAGYEETVAETQITELLPATTLATIVQNSVSPTENAPTTENQQLLGNTDQQSTTAGHTEITEYQDQTSQQSKTTNLPASASAGYASDTTFENFETITTLLEESESATTNQQSVTDTFQASTSPFQDSTVKQSTLGTGETSSDVDSATEKLETVVEQMGSTSEVITDSVSQTNKLTTNTILVTSTQETKTTNQYVGTDGTEGKTTAGTAEPTASQLITSTQQPNITSVTSGTSHQSGTTDVISGTTEENHSGSTIITSVQQSDLTSVPTDAISQTATDTISQTAEQKQSATTNTDSGTTEPESQTRSTAGISETSQVSASTIQSSEAENMKSTNKESTEKQNTGTHSLVTTDSAQNPSVSTTRKICRCSTTIQSNTNAVKTTSASKPVNITQTPDSKSTSESEAEIVYSTENTSPRPSSDTTIFDASSQSEANVQPDEITTLTPNDEPQNILFNSSNSNNFGDDSGIPNETGSTKSPETSTTETSYINSAIFNHVDPGLPLFLTPFIEHGKIKAAQMAAQVKGIFPREIESYSGFITINKKHGSNTFFWFFPAEKDPEHAPTILWVEGGPGESGFYSLFEQSGPYRIFEGLTMKERKGYWSKSYNMLYVDSPIGVGYSFTIEQKGYAHSMNDIAKDMYDFLTQFNTLFPQYRKGGLYISGLSFGGKEAAYMGQLIALKNLVKKQHDPDFINFKGLILASGMMDLLHMSDVSDFYYQLGLIDKIGQRQLKRMYLDILFQFEIKHDSIRALELSEELSKTANLESGYSSGTLKDPVNAGIRTDEYFQAFVQLPYLRKHLHVGKLKFHIFHFSEIDIIKGPLRPEYLISQAPQIELLLKHGYSILYYAGQYDLILLNTKAAEFLDNLQWSGSQQWSTIERKQWNVNGTLAGYMKEFKNLTFVLVREAGHIVAKDKPEWTYELITRYMNNSICDDQK